MCPPHISSHLATSRHDPPSLTFADPVLIIDAHALQAHDQLLLARRAGAAFEGFTEAPLRFAPTYKYDIGSDVFDTSEKRRPPAWCDRVLWKANVPPPPSGSKLVAARCTSYERHEERTSDHRPVSAALELLVARTNDEQRARVFKEISRSLDAWENSCVPTAEVRSSSPRLLPALICPLWLLLASLALPDHSCRSSASDV